MARREEGDETRKEALAVVGPKKPAFFSVMLLVFKVFVYQGQCVISVYFNVIMEIK